MQEGFFLLLSGFLGAFFFLPSAYSHIILILYINKLLPSFFHCYYLRFLIQVMLLRPLPFLPHVQSMSLEHVEFRSMFSFTHLNICLETFQLLSCSLKNIG